MRTSSTSAALMFSPPRMMTSEIRSVIDEVSVWVEHADVAGVVPAVAGRTPSRSESASVYPKKHSGPRERISPGSPVATSRPSGSTSLISFPGSGRPSVDRRFSSESA